MQFRVRTAGMYGPMNLFCEADTILADDFFQLGRLGGNVPLDNRLEPIDDEARAHFDSLRRGTGTNIIN